jgi:hypothetical protein
VGSPKKPFLLHHQFLFAVNALMEMHKAGSGKSHGKEWHHAYYILETANARKLHAIQLLVANPWRERM